MVSEASPDFQVIFLLVVIEHEFSRSSAVFAVDFKEDLGLFDDLNVFLIACIVIKDYVTALICDYSVNHILETFD